MIFSCSGQSMGVASVNEVDKLVAASSDFAAPKSATMNWFAERLVAVVVPGAMVVDWSLDVVPAVFVDSSIMKSRSDAAVLGRKSLNRKLSDETRLVAGAARIC